jgi:hypothetical protein
VYTGIVFLSTLSSEGDRAKAGDRELSIKSALGKLEADPHEVLAGVEPAGFNHLPIVGGHAAKFKELPPIHKIHLIDSSSCKHDLSR